MEAGAGEVALNEELVEFGGAGHGRNKDNELVEFEGVKEVNQFPVLFLFGQGDVVLLESVELELGPIVDVDLEWLEGRIERDGECEKAGLVSGWWIVVLMIFEWMRGERHRGG